MNALHCPDPKVSTPISSYDCQLVYDFDESNGKSTDGDSKREALFANRVVSTVCIQNSYSI